MYYSIVIFDEPNTAKLRDIHRKAHLDYLQAFDEQTLFAGPFTTDDESADLGSLRLIDFPDTAAVEEHIAERAVASRRLLPGGDLAPLALRPCVRSV